jgi:hypothetical protein
MELELLRWMARRWLTHPWVFAAWLALASLGLWLLRMSGASIRPEHVSEQALIAELGFVWGLVGGLFAIAALAEIESRTNALGALRRWRVRACVLIALTVAPAFPILLAGGILSRSAGVESCAMLSQLLAAALVAERIPWASLRSIVFLALAWWLPAVTPGWTFGPSVWIENSGHPRSASHAAADSALWSVWVGSMLTLVLFAVALDLVRRPHHEVRHSR